MLDVNYYREQERLAKSLCPSRIMVETHNLDVFEKFGFPVRVDNFQQTYMISDSMQEHRFEAYMEELDGLSHDEFSEFKNALLEHIKFQYTAYPSTSHNGAYIPFDTIFSAFVIYKKITRLKPNFKTILEIGPGSGGLAFFLVHHKDLTRYTQIESCESFYLLQSEINRFLFGAEFSEKAFTHNASKFFSVSNATKRHHVPYSCRSKVYHYPYWKIGEIYETHAESYDVVTSNANLAEFNPRALADYLALINRVLKNDGIFFVHCFGSTSINNIHMVYEVLYRNEFAPIFFYDYVDNRITEKYGEDLLRFIKKLMTREGTKVTLFPAGEASMKLYSMLKDNTQKVTLCDDFKAGEIINNERIVAFSELGCDTKVIVTSYDATIIEHARERAKTKGIELYSLSDIIACLSLVVGHGVFIKRRNPVFGRYYSKENFSEYFKILDENAHKAIFMRFDKKRKNKKRYSKTDIAKELCE